MSQGKRILMLTHEFPPFRGGIARYASQLASAASAIGHDVLVVAPDYGEDCAALDCSTFSFEVHRYSAGSYGPRELARVIHRCFQCVKKGVYDVIHAVDPSYVLALAFVHRIRSLQYHATVYGTDILGMRTSLQATCLGLRDMFTRPMRLHAISEFTRRLLLQSCPHVIPDRIQVTPLGVDPFWFGSPAMTEETIKELGLPNGKSLILTVARLDSRKGHRGVLRALASLEPALKEQICYAIVGQTHDRTYIQELNRLAADTGCDVRFLSGLTDHQLRDLYAQAKIFCMPGEPHPAKVEGFGLVYLEAAAQGLPSIGSNLGAVPEVVLHNRTGIIVPPYKITDTASAIRRLLTDEPLRSSLGSQALAQARKYSWRDCALQTYGDAQ